MGLPTAQGLPTYAQVGIMGTTRDDILDIAERFIQRRGYNAFSYADIAEELGIKTASVHYHFRGKATLGKAVAKRYIDRKMAWLTGLAEEHDGPDRVHEFLEGYRGLLRGERMCLCLMLAAEQLTLPDELAAEVERFVRGNVDWLAQAFEESMSAEVAMVEANRLFAAVEGALVMGRALDRTDLFDLIVQPWDEGLDT